MLTRLNENYNSVSAWDLELHLYFKPHFLTLEPLEPNISVEDEYFTILAEIIIISLGGPNLS